jgi:hypothetical protein
VALYHRLPEIYRLRDAEQVPTQQLQSYLALVEFVYSEIHRNIESLYHDLFIETCDDWVIPYLGDLLGTSALKGDPWTLRADVADTIALRRRKGTLGAIARLTYDLTRWGVHCVELRESLLWHQHLNHQRPDEGGKPPYRDRFKTGELKASPTLDRQALHRQANQAVRGGNIPLRDPALLSLLGTPFDPFAYTPDLKPPALGNVRYNLPNLAIFLWRLAAYRVDVSRPVLRGTTDLSATATGDQARFVVRLDVHPGEVGQSFTEPVRLFNTARFDPDRQPPVLSLVDEIPGPIPPARLTQGSIAGVPAQYVSVEVYDPASLSQPDNPLLDVLTISEVGLQFHLPQPPFAGEDWSFRGANLCAWEDGLRTPLNNREIAIDPLIGRVVMGVNSNAEATALQDNLLLTYTYGAVGPVGAHPISRAPAPQQWVDETVDQVTVNYHHNPNGLQAALANIEALTRPLVIEIQDSMTHVLDVGAIAGTLVEEGGANLRLNRSLVIRASSGQRPTIVLTQPLRFRPTNVVGTTAEEQNQFDAVMDRLTVRLEGLYLTRSSSFPAGESLIARAALHQLEVLGCTLDPGGFRQLDDSRAPIQTALRLRQHHGFVADSDPDKKFKQTPQIVVQRSITGPLLIDIDYTLSLTDTILDAGKGVDDDPGTRFALSGATQDWGPATTVSGITVFGRMRVEQIQGKGGIWVHALEVLNNQTGCLKFSSFSGKGDRLPQNHACVTGAVLNFVSESFGHPAYAQLEDTTDRRILEQGPNEDAMGAFGFLLEAHKWRNLQIRYREFMPVGIRPLFIPVT